MPALEFESVHSYASNRDGISVPIRLKSGLQAIQLLAYIDTGASNCLFERQHGELLKFDIEAGERRIFKTAAGGVHAFGHMVSIEVLGLKFESMAYFFADEEIRKNVLGRTGWLDRVRFGLVDYDRKFYLSAYDYESAGTVV